MKPSTTSTSEREAVIDEIASSSVAHFEQSLQMDSHRAFSLKKHLRYAAKQGLTYFPRKSAIDNHEIKLEDVARRLEAWGD